MVYGVDAGAGDLAAPPALPDLAPPAMVDMAQPRDTAALVDLAAPRDLAAPVDMTTPADMTQSPPDLDTREARCEWGANVYPDPMQNGVCWCCWAHLIFAGDQAECDTTPQCWAGARDAVRGTYANGTCACGPPPPDAGP